MKKTMVVGSIFCAVVILGMAFASVVGSQASQSPGPETGSPLFSVQTVRANQQSPLKVSTAFLGKGRHTPLFSPSTSNHEELIQTAITLFRTHPAVFSSLLEKLDRYPYLAGLLAKYNIKPGDIKHYIHLIQDNPTLITEETIAGCLVASDSDPPKPLGLSTSNALGCFIVAVFALLPLTVVFTLLLLFFTLRILTCMNVNDCANALAQKIWDQMIQGLTQG